MNRRQRGRASGDERSVVKESGMMFVMGRASTMWMSETGLKSDDRRMPLEADGSIRNEE